jgi:hypothetical protein
MVATRIPPGDLTHVWADLSILSVMFTLCVGRYRQVRRMAWILAGLCPTVEMSPFPSRRGRSSQVVIQASFH